MSEPTEIVQTRWRCEHCRRSFASKSYGYRFTQADMAELFQDIARNEISWWFVHKATNDQYAWAADVLLAAIDALPEPEPPPLTVGSFWEVKDLTTVRQILSVHDDTVSYVYAWPNDDHIAGFRRLTIDMFQKYSTPCDKPEWWPL